MRTLLLSAILCTATACLAADDLPKATRVIEGPLTTFPQKSLPEGVKLLRAAIESCHDINDETVQYSITDLQNAKKGDYVEFLFPRAMEVEVLRTKLKVSEAVYAKGVFWLLSGKDVMRCTKHEFDKMDRFTDWYRQILPAD